MQKKTISSVTLILIGSILSNYSSVGDGWTATVIGIAGAVCFFVGLGNLKTGLDETGKAGIQMLTISAVITIISPLVQYLPLAPMYRGGFEVSNADNMFRSMLEPKILNANDYVKIVLNILAFVLQVLGILKLKDCNTYGEHGKSGAKKLLTSVILLLVASIIGLLPAVGGIAGKVFIMVAMVITMSGWIKIQEGLVKNLISDDLYGGKIQMEAVSSIGRILVGASLSGFTVLDHSWAPKVLSIIGYFILFKGLGNLKSYLDAKGKSGVQQLTVAAILGIVAGILTFIPFLGGILASPVLFIAFIMELVGLFGLKGSDTLGSEGSKGVGNLLFAIVLSIIGGIFGFIPLVGGTIASIIGLIVILLRYLGWFKIQGAVLTHVEENK